MLQTLKHSLALCFLFFCATSNAERITHNFHSKSLAGTLVNDGSTTRSTNDGIVYAREGDAEFYYDYLHPTGTGATICLNFTKNGDNAIVSPAFNNLNSVTINYVIDKDSNLEKYISVYLSTDGSDWASITPSLSYTSTHIVVTPPSTGTYYVKIACTKNANISIFQIVYITSSSDCNCFIYTPE